MTSAWSRLGVAAVVITVVALSALLGGALRHPSSARASGVNPEVRAATLQSGFGTANTAALVGSLQTAVRAAPHDSKSAALLGLAYEQRARETGDPAYYSKAGSVLRDALRDDPRNLYATSGLGSLALSRHRFRLALSLGRQAHALSPTTALTYGLTGDALIELGRYREAFAHFDRMVTLRPSLAAYARVSYARELIGHQQAAVNAMKLALDAATGAPEAQAWTLVQLGKLYWSHGQIDAAARQYQAALQTFSGYVYAYDALAQVEAARGNLKRAIALETRAVDTIPLPQFVASLGDIYRGSGQPRLAARQYALIGAIEKLLAANGVKTDLETALFDVDHGKQLKRALARARVGQQNRPSIDGDDVLAWALERTGRCGEALRYSNHALRLGTLDALKIFHRGMIQRCLGRTAEAKASFARALRLNPHFSLLYAPMARRLS